MYKRYDIDTTQVYSYGISNGGLMSLRLAAQLDNRISKIAPIISTLLYSTAEFLKFAPSIPVLLVNGTNDDFIPYEGGLDSVYSVPQTIDILRTHNQCTILPDSIELPNIDLNDGFTATFFPYRSDIGNDVIFYRLNGMGHQWPGTFWFFPIPPHGDINTAEHIWNFFINDTFTLQSHIWARSVKLNSKFMKAGSDTLTITSNFYNKEDHDFNAFAIIQSADETVIDTFELNDDGKHHDKAIGDNVFVGYILPQIMEKTFKIILQAKLCKQ